MQVVVVACCAAGFCERWPVLSRLGVVREALSRCRVSVVARCRELRIVESCRESSRVIKTPVRPRNHPPPSYRPPSSDCRPPSHCSPPSYHPPHHVSSLHSPLSLSSSLSRHTTGIMSFCPSFFLPFVVIMWLLCTYIQWLRFHRENGMAPEVSLRN